MVTVFGKGYSTVIAVLRLSRPLRYRVQMQIDKAGGLPCESVILATFILVRHLTSHPTISPQFSRCPVVTDTCQSEHS